MVDLEDGVSHLDSGVDFDAAGRFNRGADGYDLGESVDYHDLEGNRQELKVPRIIGKTPNKTENLTEGFENRKLTI